MSNRICKRCRSTNVFVHASCGGTTYYYCNACQDWGEKDQFPEQTVFDRITASPEVLAEKLVYQRHCKMIHQNDKRTIEYWTYSWKSTVIQGQSFETKAEAIAATVAKLKEIEN